MLFIFFVTMISFRELINFINDVQYEESRIIFIKINTELVHCINKSILTSLVICVKDFIKQYFNTRSTLEVFESNLREYFRIICDNFNEGSRNRALE